MSTDLHLCLPWMADIFPLCPRLILKGAERVDRSQNVISANWLAISWLNCSVRLSQLIKSRSRYDHHGTRSVQRSNSSLEWILEGSWITSATLSPGVVEPYQISHTNNPHLIPHHPPPIRHETHHHLPRPFDPSVRLTPFLPTHLTPTSLHPSPPPDSQPLSLPLKFT